MIGYTGKNNLKNKINALIDEMYDDTEFIYKIKIEEHRENECLKEVTITTEEVRSSMPEF